MLYREAKIIACISFVLDSDAHTGPAIMHMCYHHLHQTHQGERHCQETCHVQMTGLLRAGNLVPIPPLPLVLSARPPHHSMEYHDV